MLYHTHTQLGDACTTAPPPAARAPARLLLASDRFFSNVSDAWLAASRMSCNERGADRGTSGGRVTPEKNFWEPVSGGRTFLV